MRNDPANADFCSTREAAELLGVALRTVQLWVESGVLRAWKTAGGHRRISRASVESLLRERQRALDPQTADASATESGLSERPFRLLVVEDEPALLKLFHLQIQGWGIPIDLITATNGFEGLIRIGEKRPDLLISDLNMPGMDGFRMIRSLASSSDYADLNIVVVTALSLSDIEDRGGLPTNVRVFTKPIPFADLRQIVVQLRESGKQG